MTEVTSPDTTERKHNAPDWMRLTKIKKVPDTKTRRGKNREKAKH